MESFLDPENVRCDREPTTSCLLPLLLWRRGQGEEALS
jgi:hypothetical protein